MAFLSDVQPISADFKPQGNSTYKAEMLASLKIAFDGGSSEKFRRKREKVDGKWIDMNPDWGLIRIPNIPDLTRELQNYKMDDGKIANDSVMALGMPIHWLELRRPKRQRKSAAELDFLGM